MKATNANKVKQKEEKNEKLKENEDLFKQKTEGILYRLIMILYSSRRQENGNTTIIHGNWKKRQGLLVNKSHIIQ